MAALMRLFDVINLRAIIDFFFFPDVGNNKDMAESVPLPSRWLQATGHPNPAYFSKKCK